MQVLSTTVDETAVAVDGRGSGYGDTEGKADVKDLFQSVKKIALAPENYRKYGQVFPAGHGSKAAWLKSRSNDIAYLLIRNPHGLYTSYAMMVYSVDDGPVGLVQFENVGKLPPGFSKKLQTLVPTSWISPKYRGRGIMSEVYAITLTKNALNQSFSQTKDSSLLWQRLANKGYPVFFFQDDTFVGSDPRSDYWTDPNTEQYLTPRGIKFKES